MKILCLDVETSPNTAYVWSLWKETIPLTRLIENSEVLCYSAKFLGDDHIYFDSIYHSSAEHMLEGIHALMDEADVLVHYNGNSFDIPCLNKEYLLYGMTPPAPSKQVDLLKVVRRNFRFTSNKLDHVSQRLGLGKKEETSFQLWIDCLNHNPTAWKQMEKYNKKDVILLEKLYKKLLPWIKGHPNHALYSAVSCCPNCGSGSFVKRGFSYTNTMKYQRYRCKDCGAWFRDRKAIKKEHDVYTSI